MADDIKLQSSDKKLSQDASKPEETPMTFFEVSIFIVVFKRLDRF